jgi:hypothetical protein
VFTNLYRLYIHQIQNYLYSCQTTFIYIIICLCVIPMQANLGMNTSYMTEIRVVLGCFRGDIAINHGEVFHVKQLLWDVVTSHHPPRFDGPMILWVWGWIYSFSFSEMTINSEHQCIPTTFYTQYCWLCITVVGSTI